MSKHVPRTGFEPVHGGRLHGMQAACTIDALPGFYITCRYRFASHLPSVGPITTLCKAAELHRRAGRPLRPERPLSPKEGDQCHKLAPAISSGTLLSPGSAVAGADRRYKSTGAVGSIPSGRICFLYLRPACCCFCPCHVGSTCRR